MDYLSRVTRFDRHFGHLHLKKNVSGEGAGSTRIGLGLSISATKLHLLHENLSPHFLHTYIFPLILIYFFLRHRIYFIFISQAPRL